MPRQVIIPFRTPHNQAPNPMWGSVLHGMLMEQLSSEKATALHQNRRPPWAQYVTRCHDGGALWVVSLLTQEIERVFDAHILSMLPKEFHLRQKGYSILMQPPVTDRYLVDSWFFESTEKTGNQGARFEITFLTPTAFKQNGKYVAQPDIRLIYYSLASRWNEICDLDICPLNVSEEHMQEVCVSTHVANDFTSESAFSVNGKPIKGFRGTIILTCEKTIVARKWRMLFRYAQFCGVGIKTALGMGAFCLKSDNEVNS
ncbi:MAG TPA: CRISPR system precrRNA processing endoribonuclease RAMP protein Cas6 [Clostridiaceae bacterium]|nr:CRISPR system precrRNA processing endoribonuclease RAMP protein Cas6 [Clostridiaceae bacterium]